jgi:hypothetical protein
VVLFPPFPPNLTSLAPCRVFPFDFQNNQCRAVTDFINENGYIAPSTQLLFRLKKRSDLTACIDFADVAETTYYGDAAVAVRPKIEIDLKDLTLSYEVLALSSQERMDKTRRSSIKYFVDIPRVLVSNVLDSLKVTNHVVPIPVGCKMVAITWMKSHQVHYNQALKKSLLPHFHYPPHANKVEFELDGRKLLFERGIDNVGLPDSHWSKACHDLYSKMVHQGVYSKRFEDMFPSSGGGHDQIFFFDFLYREFKEPSQLHLEVAYTGDMSPKGWSMVSITSQQFSFTLKERDPLKIEVLV